MRQSVRKHMGLQTPSPNPTLSPDLALSPNPTLSPESDIERTSGRMSMY